MRRLSTKVLCFTIMGVLALSMPGCADQRIRAGTAFQKDDPISTGDKPIPPGFEIGLLDVYIANSSTSTVTIDSIGLSGPGIGTVVRPVQIAIAPLRFGRHDYEMNATPAALYTTNPPVFFYGNQCHKQALFKVKGYRMTPGSQARIWIVLRAVRAGKWVIPSHVVYYTSDGAKYRQAIPLRESGSVAADAPYIPPYSAEVKCVGPATGARLLPGYAHGKPSR